MAIIIESKNFKINLDNPDKKEVAKLKKANPKLYAKFFEVESETETETETESETEN